MRKTLCNRKSFKREIVEFLKSVAPAGSNSKTKPHMPSFWTGPICSRIPAFFKVIYNLWKHKSVWNSELVFKPIIEKEIVYEDNTPKKFIDIGRNMETGELVVSCAVTCTDVGNRKTLVFSNEKESDPVKHFEESQWRKVILRNEQIPASLPMSASAALPFFFSKVKFPAYRPKEYQTSLMDGGAVSNLSAQLLKVDYGNGKENSPVRIALSCNEFEYNRKVAYDEEAKPLYPVESGIDIATGIFAVVIEDNMADDVEQLLKTGGSEEHIFIIKTNEGLRCPPGEEPFLHESVGNFAFLDLTDEITENLFNFGAWVTEHKFLNRMKPEEYERAQRNGVTVALSGGGALYPVLFGAVYTLWCYFQVHALAGTSAGALAASYMCEAIGNQEINN